MLRTRSKQLFMEPETKDPWTNMENVIANQTLYRALDEMVTHYHTAIAGQESLNFRPDRIYSLIDMARDMFVFSATTFTRSSANDDDQEEASTDENRDDGDDDDGNNGECGGREDKETKSGG